MKYILLCILAASVQLGCARSPKVIEDKLGIKSAIQSLTYSDDDILIISEIGGNVIARTERERYIISHGNNSVPFLIDALITERNPLIIGGAAFCLEKIGDRSGFAAAKVAKQKINVGASREAMFGLRRLDEYLLTE